MHSRRRVVRGITPEGKDVALVLDVTPDRLIGLFAKTDEAVLITPRQISQLIEHLRALQAAALDGLVWPELRS